MIDVHPPHASILTWKDFWIHLGTITLGLLIAIGLEQSVEALHHRHQRHQLERDLHTEAVRNDAILGRDIAVLRYDRITFAAFRANVDALRRGVPPALAPMRPHPHYQDLFLPSAGAWASARDSMELALLPRELASVYEELYAQRDFLTPRVTEWFDAQDQLDTFTSQFIDPAQGEHLDPTYLTAAQRDEYSMLLRQLTVKTDDLQDDLIFYRAENTAVKNGVESVDQLHENILHQDLLPPPKIGTDSEKRKNP